MLSVMHTVRGFYALDMLKAMLSWMSPESECPLCSQPTVSAGICFDSFPFCTRTQTHMCVQFECSSPNFPFEFLLRFDVRCCLLVAERFDFHIKKTWNSFQVFYFNFLQLFSKTFRLNSMLHLISSSVWLTILWQLEVSQNIIFTRFQTITSRLVNHDAGQRQHDF